MYVDKNPCAHDKMFGYFVFNHTLQIPPTPLFQRGEVRCGLELPLPLLKGGWEGFA